MVSLLKDKFGGILREINRFTGFIRQNKLICAVFLFSLSFFIYQHSTGFSWDFSAYVLNARYLLGEGFNFEWIRQPLPSLIILAFSFLGLASEYVYIIFVSLLHLYSSLKFSEKFDVDRTAFYVFSMNVFALIFALKVGSELLSLALLQLFLAHIYEKRSGIYYGLSVLARYTNINFIILFLLQKKAGKIVFSLLLALLAAMPWLIFSYANTGNPFIGFIDSYALNVNMRNRDGVASPFLATDLLFAFNFTLPLFLIGLSSRRNKNYYLILFVAALSVVSFATIPMKEARYLFPITIGAAYFSAISVKDYEYKKTLLYAFVLLTALSLLLMPSAIREQENPQLYTELAGKNITCMAKSNAWVPLNYYGLPSEPYPEKEQLEASLNSGYVVILVKGISSPDYLHNEPFLRQHPIMEETKDYIILQGEGCRPQQKSGLIFLDRVADYYETLDRNVTKCEIAFGNICRYFHAM